MKRLTGKIRWFDALSGEGMVRCSKTNQNYFLHFTSIQGISKNNYAFPDDKDREVLSSLKGRTCTFEVFTDPTFSQADNLILEGAE